MKEVSLSDELNQEELDLLDRMFGRSEEKEEPVKREINRGQFMTRLETILKDHCRLYEDLVEQAGAEAGLVSQCLELRERVFSLEDNNYRLKFFIDDSGNIQYEAKAKDDMGFLSLSNKEADNART